MPKAKMTDDNFYGYSIEKEVNGFSAYSGTRKKVAESPTLLGIRSRIRNRFLKLGGISAVEVKTHWYDPPEPLPPIQILGINVTGTMLVKEIKSCDPPSLGTYEHIYQHHGCPHLFPSYEQELEYAAMLREFYELRQRLLRYVQKLPRAETKLLLSLTDPDRLYVQKDFEKT